MAIQLKLLVSTMFLWILFACTPAFATDATFYNKTAVDVKVEWSFKGAAKKEAVIKPNASATFSHGRMSMIDYRLLLLRDNQWIEFDKDWVTLTRDRKGKIEKLSEHSVKWNRVIGF